MSLKNKVKKIKWNSHDIVIPEGYALGEYEGSGFPVALKPEMFQGHEIGDLISSLEEDIKLICLMTDCCPCDMCTDARAMGSM